MTDPYAIRLLAPGDADAWFALRMRALRDHPTAFLADEEDEARKGVAFVRERLADPPAQSFVLGAWAGARLAGNAGVFRYGGRKTRHNAVLWGVYVAPEHRRVSLGRRLVTEAIAAARAMPGVERLCLSVDAQNEAARALYRSLGFVTWGVEPDAFRAAGRSVAEEHMALTLAPGQGA